MPQGQQQGNGRQRQRAAETGPPADLVRPYGVPPPAEKQVERPAPVQGGDGQQVKDAQQQICPRQGVVPRRSGQDQRQQQVYHGSRQGAEDLPAVGQVAGVRPDLRAKGGEAEALHLRACRRQGGQVAQLMAQRREGRQRKDAPCPRRQGQSHPHSAAPRHLQPTGFPHRKWGSGTATRRGAQSADGGRWPVAWPVQPTSAIFSPMATLPPVTVTRLQWAYRVI